MHPLLRLAASTVFLNLATATNPIFYSNTWSGAGQIQQNGTLPFSSIEATLIIPHLELPTHPVDNVDQYSGSFWIGLDGYKSPPHNGLWQAGVIMHIWTNGTREYVPFWEWVPDPETFIYDNDFKISEGEHIHVALNVSSNGTQATATMSNLNSTKTISTTRSAPTSWRGPDWVASGGSAEWIVETGTYENYTRQVFPDFGRARFVDARAWRQSGEVVLPGDVGGLQMFENFWSSKGMLYTKSEVEGTEVGVKYVEEMCEACGEECKRVGSCEVIIADEKRSLRA